jgi:L(+)-tartrate dehydratase beta subunit
MEKGLTIPLSLEDIVDLEVGDVVYFDGLLFTGLGRFHRRVLEKGLVPPIDFSRTNVLLHAGLVAQPKNGGWEAISIDPAPSRPFELYGPGIIKRLGLRAIIGRTTMGPDTMRAAKELGCIHVTKVGIYGRNLAWRVKRVVDVYNLGELGPAEATWVLEATDFGPFVVDIDTHGHNLFDQVKADVDERRREVYRSMGLDEDERLEG